MAENVYFENMMKVGEAFENRRRTHTEKKREIVEKYGWESPEYKAWSEEADRIDEERPFTSGEGKALRAWMYGRGADGEILVDDFCWEYESADFVNTFRKAGIKSFIVIEDSTALMRNIHEYVKAGCRLVGFVLVREGKTPWNAEVPGLRFEID